MAENDVFPSYFDSILAFYSGPAAGAGGNPPPPDPRELFTGIGNWADFCIAPRGTVIKHPAEPIDNFPGGAEPPDHQDDGVYGGPFYPEPVDQPVDPNEWRQQNDNRPQNLPMPGLTVDSFFDAANMLTGGDIDGIGDLWEILREDHNDFLQEAMSGNEIGPNVFFATIDTILRDWSGDASAAAEVYSAGLRDAVNSQIKITGWLADALMAYTGIMVGARRQMLDLMRAFRETMRNTEKTSAQDDRNFVMGVLATVVAAMVTAGAAIMTAETGGLGGALATQFVTTAIGLTNQVLTQKGENDKRAVIGDSYADIAVSYLQHAGEIVTETKKALYELVNGVTLDNPMSNLVMDSHWATVPPALVTSKQFDSDPGAIDDL
jgi:hypothetical protein